MADRDQTQSASEGDISVDINAADDSKAVTRRTSSDIAKTIRDNADVDAKPERTPGEKDLFKRMGRFERHMQRSFDQKLADQEARHQKELSDLRAKLERGTVDRGGTDDAADAAHDAAIGALKDKLAAANEKGDSQAAADITAQMSKLDAQFWAKKAAAAGVTTRAATTETRTAPATETPAARANGPTVAGSRFIKSNEDWWDDPEYEVEKAAANTIYLNLVTKEGFDPKDDETFKEVAKQMKVKFPTLEVHGGQRSAGDSDEYVDEERVTRTQRRAAPAARIDDRGQASDRNRGKMRSLTKQEIQTMRDCRLDPDNDEHVVRFTKEILAMEANA